MTPFNLKTLEGRLEKAGFEVIFPEMGSYPYTKDGTLLTEYCIVHYAPIRENGLFNEAYFLAVKSMYDRIISINPYKTISLRKDSCGSIDWTGIINPKTKKDIFLFSAIVGLKTDMPEEKFKDLFLSSPDYVR